VILAHDLGTTGDKAALYSPAGELVGATVARYATDYGADGHVEQDAGDWWAAIGAATRELFATTGVRAEEVACVSFSGQMMGALLLDGHGEPVRPALIWADTRSAAQCDRMVERIGMERGYELIGHRLNPTYSLTKVMWVREHEPELFARVRHVVLAKDYAAYRLTGELATDPSDASSTNAFDQRAGAWSEELLEAAELDRGLFPEVVPSTTVLGGVTRAAAADTGLAEGTPVVLGGGDGPCAALGAGVISASSGAYAYLGSSSWVSMAASEPLHDPAMRTMTFNHVLPDAYVPTATMQAGGASFEWISEVLSERPAALGEAAAGVEAAFDGLLFLPHLLGERSPYWNPLARGAFVGLQRHHGRAELARAVLEGVAMNLYTGLAAFEEMGASIGTVDAIGGGAASDTWLQVLADVWGKEVRRRSLVDEANALGAAVVGGVGVGMFEGFDVAPGFSSLGAAFTPDRERHERYAERYALFLEAYERLEDLFGRL
jgi:xylulokinase